MAYEREFKITHTIRGMYDDYVGDRINKQQEKLTKTQFKSIAYDFMEGMSGIILHDAFEYKMPRALGYLRIKTTKLKYKIKNGRIMPRKGIIDWGSCRKLWKEMYPDLTIKDLKEIKDKPFVFYTNEHTNGEVYKWYWDKRTCHIANKSVYTFEPVKQNRLKLKDIVTDENNERKYNQ